MQEYYYLIVTITVIAMHFDRSVTGLTLNPKCKLTAHK